MSKLMLRPELKLNTSQREDLARLENLVEAGINTYNNPREAHTKIGTALLQIRDQRLYREQYDTFEQYVKNRWPALKPRI